VGHLIKSGLGAVLSQCLDGEGWQAEDGVAGRGLDRPDGQFLAPAAGVATAVANDAGRTVGSTMVSAWRNRTVPASRSRSVHSRPHSSPLRARSPPQAPSRRQAMVRGCGRQRPTAPRPAPAPAQPLRGVGVAWSDVLGDIAGDQPPGDRLLERAVQAAMHGQNVLGASPPGFPSRRPPTLNWS
jgi:hypothetical protein